MASMRRPRWTRASTRSPTFRSRGRPLRRRARSIIDTLCSPPTPADDHRAVRRTSSVPGYGAGSRTRDAVQVRDRNGPGARHSTRIAGGACSGPDPRGHAVPRAHAGGRSPRRAARELRARLRGRIPNARRCAGPRQERSRGQTLDEDRRRVVRFGSGTDRAGRAGAAYAVRFGAGADRAGRAGAAHVVRV